MQKRKWIVFTASLLLFIASITAANLYFIVGHAKEDVSVSMFLELQNTEQELHRWVDIQHRLIGKLASVFSTRFIQRQGFEERPLTASFASKEVQAAVTNMLSPLARFSKYLGYTIVGFDNRLLASAESIRGVESFLLQFPELQTAMQQNQIVISPPFRDGAGQDEFAQFTQSESLLMFAGAPITNKAGEPVAMLLLWIDPADQFFAVLEGSRIGVQGESFVFTDKALLLSNTRSEHIAKESGMIEDFQLSALNVELRDPGVNLAEGLTAKLPRSEQPFTQMAASAMAGQDGSNMNLLGYRNYLGIPVVGAWKWDDKLNMGLATELPTAEAYDTLFTNIESVLIMHTLTEFAIIFCVFFLYRQQRKSNETYSLLQGIIAHSPVSILARDIDGKCLFDNQVDFNLEQPLAGQSVQLSADEQNVITQKKSITTEEEFGNTIQQIVKFPLLDNQSNNAFAVCSVSMDITAIKTIEDELRYRAEFEALITELSTHFIGLQHEEIDSGVGQALEKICQFANLSSGTVYNYSKAGKALQISHMWSTNSIHQLDQTYNNIDDNSAAWWMETLREFKPVVVNSLHALPKKANFPRDYVQSESIKSIVLVPLIWQYRLIGFISFTSVQQRDWLPIEISLFEMIGQMIANALQRKHTAERLSMALETAESANQAKSVFLSRMSHELRTPLNAIMGFAELFKFSKVMTDVEKSNAEKILNASRHLVMLVNDVMDISKIDAGHEDLILEPVPVSTLIDECIQLTKSSSAGSNVSLNFDQNGCDAWVQADHTRLRQVILNLLSNAVKYNKANGRVDITVSRSDDIGVNVVVMDTGLGIPEDQIKNLYEPFQRLGAENSQIEGAGVGMFICKRLVELMQGDISVISRVGEGSIFTLNLPECNPGRTVRDFVAQKSLSPWAQQQQLATNKSAHILIAEDNLVNQDIILQQLEFIGLTADVANDGVEAFELYRQQPYDLLLTDCNMPEMDGYQLAGAIRKNEQADGTKLPIIAITGNALNGDREKCLAAGMDDFITKPVELADLNRVLNSWLSGSPRPPDSVSSVDSVGSGTEELAVTNSEQQDLAIDSQALDKIVGSDRNLQLKLLQKFNGYAPDIVADILSAYQQQSAEEIASYSHKLKSSARAIGANEMADFCEALELAGKASNWQAIQKIEPLGITRLMEDVQLYIEQFAA